MIKIVNIKDIAEKAGVSIATVSHVINKTRYVSENLTLKVNSVIEELNYTPNLVAASLRKKYTSIIGVVVSDASFPVIAELVNNIDKNISIHGYDIVLTSTFYSVAKEKRILNDLISKRVDGIIIFPENRNPNQINKIIESGIPVVVIDRMIPEIKADSIWLDGKKIGYEVTKYLISLGHKTIVLLDRIVDISHNIALREGFIEALSDSKIKIKEDLIIRCKGGGFIDGYKIAKSLLKHSNNITSFIARSDFQAIGALRAINESGLKVPYDISLVGYSDSDICDYVTPRLSSIHYPVEKIAKLATDLLLMRIKNKYNEKIKIISVAQDFIIRESIAKVNINRL